MLPAARLIHVTANDGYRFVTHLWEPPRAAARLVFLHGIISHAGWYPRCCRYLAEEGFEVHFLDRRGSGLNLADRGDVAAWEIWLDDVEDYLEQLPSDMPRLLFGISWGGVLACAVARHRPDLVAGIGLVCPGLFARQAANGVQRTAIRLAVRAGLARRRVAIPLQDPALFTQSPAYREYIQTDPLTLRTITLRFAEANLRLAKYATEAPEEIRVPTLLMLAGRDPIVDNAKTRRFVERIACNEKWILEYPQAGHTLEFEPDPSGFFTDLSGWAKRFESGAS